MKHLFATKRISDTFWALAAFLLLMPWTTNAMTPPSNCVPGKLCNPLKAPDLFTFVEQALVVVRNIGFLIAVYFIFYSGFLFVTARGNPTALEKARKAFFWALVGLAVLLGAWAFATAIDATISSL